MIDKKLHRKGKGISNEWNREVSGRGTTIQRFLLFALDTKALKWNKKPSHHGDHETHTKRMRFLLHQT